LVDDIWRVLYRWFLDLGLGARCHTLLVKMIILCGTDTFYMDDVLRRMVSCIGVGYTLERECLET
jgi:hypothetical protein